MMHKKRISRKPRRVRGARALLPLSLFRYLSKATELRVLFSLHSSEKYPNVYRIFLIAYRMIPILFLGRPIMGIGDLDLKKQREILNLKARIAQVTRRVNASSRCTKQQQDVANNIDADAMFVGLDEQQGGSARCLYTCFREGRGG